jgi:hypothetical protein
MGIKQSIWNFLGLNTRQELERQEDIVAEKIREAMYQAIDAHCSVARPWLEKKIVLARDLDALWYLRPDLMQAIAECKDQALARQAMVAITRLFKGYQKPAHVSRFSELT